MKKFISADNENISYMGRIDFSDVKSPKIIFAGSSITIRFKGTKVSAFIINHKFYYENILGVIIDGKEDKIIIDSSDKEKHIPIADNLEDTIHEVTIFKRQAANYYFEFKGFEIDGEVCEKAPKPKRRIECYGDSVSAGEVCEAIDFLASNDPENHNGIYDNTRYSYAMITARNLGAEINNIAQGGIALLDGTGYFHAPDYIGMESVYDKLCYIPEAEITSWDFDRYTPHVVIFALGQNDIHHEGFDDFDINDPEYRLKWKNGYKKIILDLREKYPNATFIMLLTVLMHNEGWDKAVEEIVSELSDNKIHYLKFKRAGKATPGHPRIPEQYEMAEELTAFISNLGDKIWE